MSKYILETKDREVELENNLVVTVKTKLTVKEKTTLNSITLMSAKLQTWEGVEEFFEKAIPIATSVITKWNVVDSEEKDVEINDESVINVLNIQDMLIIFSEILGLGEAVRNEMKKQEGSSKKTG